MKRLYIFLIMLFISGCGEESFLKREPLSKELLSSGPFYSINKCYDEIVEYRFYNKEYEKIFYKEQEFSQIEKEIRDKIEYKNDFEVVIYEGDIVLECNVADDNKDGNIELYCINQEYKDKEGYYHTKRTLYKTKELAVEHQDEDCF